MYFSQKVSTAEWEEDPEVGGEFHTLCDAGGVPTGPSRMTKAPEKPIPFKSSMREPGGLAA